MFIEDTGWKRQLNGEWTKLKPELAHTLKHALLGPSHPQLVDGGLVHIGAVNCPDTDNDVSTGVQKYTYSLYLDDQKLREFAGQWNMYVNSQTGLPVRFELLSADGNIITTETRRYSSDITIEEPTDKSKP